MAKVEVEVPRAAGLATAPLVNGAPGASVNPEPVDPARDAFLIGAGWLGTALAMSISNLPFKLLLKENLHLEAEDLSRFMLFANIPIYVKPLAGILTDAVPLFGTRRYHYLVLSLALGALCWLLLALVPRGFGTLLAAYITLNLFLTMTSTVLGGLMVEVGKRDGSTGRLSAQRQGITRIVGVVSGPLSGVLANPKVPFIIPAALCAFLHVALVPVFLYWLREPKGATSNPNVLLEVRRQMTTLFSSRTLWAAAGLVVLVIAAPGFGTPLLYHQRDVLKFSPVLIGGLETIGAIAAMGAAILYGLVCKRLTLRQLLAVSIVLHAALTLLYLFYRNPVSAIILTGIESATGVLAILPLYDLAARATPRGGEALGYSLMMSVWNFTSGMSDWFGSWLHDHLGLSFNQLVWVNSGTTILVLIAVPFLPALLMDRKDGDVGGASQVTEASH